ncbi:MAG: hypothetical protein LBO06_08330 [Bacteroidales bacterium]|jgi:hypothetical protein|nr:hypothetical protein [Bacteroidales bacterium]
MVVVFSCSKTYNKNVEYDFNRCLNIIDEFNNYEGDIDITDTIRGKLFFATEYLQKMTGIEGQSVVFAEIPVYYERKDCLNDIQKWKDWFDKNKYKLTSQYNDSIKKSIVRDKIWWEDSSILNIVFTNE